MNTNYDVMMEKQIAEMDGRKKLLLHVCCAPCASGCVDRLTPHFDLTLYFYNPNIDGVEEYNKRAEELVRFASLYLPDVEVVIAPYRTEEFFDAVKGLEKEPERGIRCTECYLLRLKAAAQYAAGNNFDYFATTLTLSPLKDAERLNKIGMSLSGEGKGRYLCSDFKKRGGNVRSGELCREYCLYRQNYCGCVFSKNNLKS